MKAFGVYHDAEPPIQHERHADEKDEVEQRGRPQLAYGRAHPGRAASWRTELSYSQQRPYRRRQGFPSASADTVPQQQRNRTEHNQDNPGAHGLDLVQVLASEPGPLQEGGLAELLRFS